VPGAEGIPQFLHGSYRDIAERKRVETQLAAARDEAREESAVKTAFLEPMSHQLFTPLNAIIGVRRPHTAGDPRTHFQTQLSGVRAKYCGTGQRALAVFREVVMLAELEADRFPLILKKSAAPATALFG
jgi:signal transduction histidine kinase